MAREQTSEPPFHSGTSATDGPAEKTIVIRDRRKPNQYTTDNVVAREWLPILRVGDAFFFYSIYLSMANRETESSWGSLRTQAEYLQCGVDLIIRGNKLLEICELLYIDTGDHRTTNEYYILDPPSLTPELKRRIYQRLGEIAAQETGKNWQSWVRQVQKALDRHRSLPSIWEQRRAMRGGRPVTTVRPPKGDSESQAPFSAPNESAGNPGCDSQPGRMWDTNGVHVSHNQGACESHAKQEQETKITKQHGEDNALLLVRDRCSCLGIAPTVIDILLSKYPVRAILQQIEWLPSRKPRDPAAMLVSAVQGGWNLPAQHDPVLAGEMWANWLGEAPDPTDEQEAESEEGFDEAGATLKAIESSPRAWVLPNSGLDAREIWHRVLEEVRMQMTRVAFDTWLRGSQVVGAGDGEIEVEVRDAYAAEWLNARWLVPIQRTLSGIVGRPTAIHFSAR